MNELSTNTAASCYRGRDGSSYQQYWLTIPEAVCTVVCSWWWAEEPTETCTASVKINKFKKHCFSLAVIWNYIRVDGNINVKNRNDNLIIIIFIIIIKNVLTVILIRLLSWIFELLPNNSKIFWNYSSMASHCNVKFSFISKKKKWISFPNACNWKLFWFSILV